MTPARIYFLVFIVYALVSIHRQLEKGLYCTINGLPSKDHLKGLFYYWSYDMTFEEIAHVKVIFTLLLPNDMRCTVPFTDKNGFVLDGYSTEQAILPLSIG